MAYLPAKTLYCVFKNCGYQEVIYPVITFFDADVPLPLPLPSRASITSQSRAHMDNYTFSVVGGLEGRVIGGDNKKKI